MVWFAKWAMFSQTFKVTHADEPLTYYGKLWLLGCKWCCEMISVQLGLKPFHTKRGSSCKKTFLQWRKCTWIPANVGKSWRAIFIWRWNTIDGSKDWVDGQKRWSKSCIADQVCNHAMLIITDVAGSYMHTAGENLCEGGKYWDGPWCQRISTYKEIDLSNDILCFSWCSG